ncbi:hypothetical protein F5X99DRAFT_396436 [Biscogniauxia marginata]|nr:hypothetical protein F5X99DRAFT_396436 [Biscogniauxia marginata]
MSALFCCDEIKPFRPQHLSHEPKFRTFMDWAAYPKEASPSEDTTGLNELKSPFVIQLVRQVNYGPLESKRYFANVKDQDEDFVEVSEDDLIQANFQKLNSFKNYRCEGHNKFFEVNVYQKDPVNKHHWRANLARPASSIDLENK